VTTTVDVENMRVEIERLQRMNTRLQAELAKLVPAHAEAHLLLGVIAYQLSPAASGQLAKRVGRVRRHKPLQQVANVRAQTPHDRPPFGAIWNSSSSRHTVPIRSAGCPDTDADSS
jgi:hypothetical protein